MKLTYTYTVHGFSGGRMLSNTVDIVTIHAKYRANEKTMTVSLSNEETFKDEANAYGFSYAFTVKE